MVISPDLRSDFAPTPIRWDDPPCLLCGGERKLPVLEAADPTPGGPGLRFAVVRCGECGLQFTSPRPDVSTIGRFYPAEYRPHHRARVKSRHSRRGKLAVLFGRVSERRGMPWHGRGRLLDFGCGGGAYLARMHRQGWTVTGLDASAETAERARSAVGVPVLFGTLPHSDLSPESFDVVTMWGSLEHVHDPLAVLTAARRLLAPGGRLFVAVPNIDSTAFRWFGAAWFGLDLPRHLTHFTPATLRRMLERADFRVTALRPIRHVEWLRSSARLAVNTGRARIWQRALTYKPMARLAAWATYLAGGSDGLMAAADCVS
jgi:2-polyprenyl-3-methyl-5-hydroxy-6-metoxy-1,4-benzoquinol methylase